MSNLFGTSGKTKAVFFRQLATMVDSGLPVGRGVKTASEMGLNAVGTKMARKIDAGATLSDAMAAFPLVFSNHEVALIKAGEATGQMDRQLNELAKSAELDWALSQKIQSAMVYPVLVAHSAILLPPLFLLVNNGLAAYVQTVLTMLIPIYLVVGALLACYTLSRHWGGPRRLLDHFVATLPVIGSPGKFGARIRFLDTLSNLIEAGFIPGQAIPLAAEACNNYWLRDRIMTSWSKLGKEVTMSAVMRDSEGFQSFELGLVSTGEETGAFSRSLKKAAETLRPEYESQIHRLSVILPIILLFMVGALVAYKAITTMTGIFAPLMDN